MFSALNEAFPEVAKDNFCVIFNKTSKRTTATKVIEWYDQALRNLKDTRVKLPKLTLESKFLIIRNDDENDLKDISKVISKTVRPFIDSSAPYTEAKPAAKIDSKGISLNFLDERLSALVAD